MKSLMMRIARRVVTAFIPDSVKYKNVTLPAKHLRFCGREFRDDEYFLASTQAEADRLTEHLGLTVNTSVLDVGCGVGRLPIGILSQIGEIRDYRGIDVSKISIRWCQRRIARKHPSFQFVHIDTRNALYNPHGRTADIGFRLPFNDQEFDIIYLYSVFSHMPDEDIRVYLKEFQRLLAPSGKVFLTAFIEEGVPDMTFNPSDYRMDWKGPLHCVRYDRDFFESLLADNDFAVEDFVYEKETDGQSALYISRRKKNIN